MTVCPICDEPLLDAAIRCRGCSVLVGAPSSSRRFAPLRKPAPPSPPQAAPAPSRGSLGIALAAAAMLLGIATIVACM